MPQKKSSIKGDFQGYEQSCPQKDLQTPSLHLSQDHRNSRSEKHRNASKTSAPNLAINPASCRSSIFTRCCVQPVVSDIMRANSFNLEDCFTVIVKRKQLLQWLNGNVPDSCSGIIVKVFWGKHGKRGRKSHLPLPPPLWKWFITTCYRWGSQEQTCYEIILFSLAGSFEASGFNSRGKK